MIQAHPTHREPARLGFADGEVLVTPKDRDVFLISAERATEACRDALRLGERIESFQSRFLVPLHAWCTAHHEKVQACFVPIAGDQVQVFLVTTSPRFDFDLADEVAALELALAQDGWRVGVSQLPDTSGDSLTTFFNPEGALEVYAQRYREGQSIKITDLTCALDAVD